MWTLLGFLELVWQKALYGTVLEMGLHSDTGPFMLLKIGKLSCEVHIRSPMQLGFHIVMKVAVCLSRKV